MFDEDTKRLENLNTPSELQASSVSGLIKPVDQSAQLQQQFNFNLSESSQLPSNTKQHVNMQTPLVSNNAAMSSILSRTTSIDSSSMINNVNTSSKNQSPATSVRPFKPVLEINKNELLPQTAPPALAAQSTRSATTTAAASATAAAAAPTSAVNAMTSRQSTAFPFSSATSSSSTTKCTTAATPTTSVFRSISSQQQQPPTGSATPQQQQQNPPAVGQVKPVNVMPPVPSGSSTTTASGSSSAGTGPASGVVKAAPLPQVLGSSTTSVPIKPLSDNKSRAVASTKPSATVTPTFKSGSATSHQAQSGLRRNSSLTTTTTTSTRAISSCTTTASENRKSSVEKGEASSTTSSPKTELLPLPSSNISNNTVDDVGISENNTKNNHNHVSVMVGINLNDIKNSSANVSPESSTHPDPISLCSNKSLDNEDLDSGVSSTTKELDNILGNKNTNPLNKILKKEVDPFGGILKTSSHHGDNKSSKTSSGGSSNSTEDSKVQVQSVLFAPTLLPPTKTTTGIKEEPNLQQQSSTKIKGDNKKESSSSHRSSKEGHRSSSHHR